MKTFARSMCSLAFAGCFLTSAVAADDASGWYAGINVGQSKAKIDDAAITDGLMGLGASGVVIDDDDRDIGYKLFGGYRFNRIFSLEGGYFDLGRFGYTATTIPAGSQSGSIRINGLNLDALGFLPFTERWSAFGRVGLNYAQAKDSFNATGAVPANATSASKRSANHKFGVGLQYDVTKSLGLRLEAERYRIDDAIGSKGDIDLLSLGVLYRFGKTAPPAPPPAPVPQAELVAAPAILLVVVAEPLPAEQPPPVAPPPTPRMAVAFSTDSFYQFDTSELSQAGKDSLDQFAAELKGVKFGVITVVGHTDRFGTHAYNQTLSEQRAEAVKAYLVVAGGIPAAKIETRGAEEKEPVTLPGDCIGKIATRKMIACLQADRRVEVDVAVTPAGK